MREPLPADMFADPGCLSRIQPFRFAGKWSAMVLRCLAGGPRRFGELRVPMHFVTPKVLTETLRALERDGLLTRTVHDERPRRVEYELTPLGRSLLGPLNTACDWTRQHLPELLRAREEYRPDRPATAREEA
ncbi:helix-turn-helix transcriptional regulator [Streptomyces sp. NBC_00846]|uniref:winged helix-turn-helix transcriptional regulator n=1 Tax=Streptomyces sp. NBC_00846 TaxID=2975849 RepID=UPI00386BF5AB|nr:helix-turn-helix transcriptional regulator [Streptomyces sp. NBC_00846]